MIDSVGNVASMLIVGGSSELAMAIADRMTGPRLARVVIADRASDELDKAVALVRRFGVSDVTGVSFEPTEPWAHGRLINDVFDAGDIDLVVLLAGPDTSQQDFEANPGDAVAMCAANYTGSVSAGLHVSRRLRAQGHGCFVVITFASRAPSSNFVYRSAMSGLDAFAVGLVESLRGSGARVIVTRIASAHSVTPSEVASAVAGAVRSRRAEIIYVPASFRTAMSGLRTLPRPAKRMLRPRGRPQN